MTRCKVFCLVVSQRVNDNLLTIMMSLVMHYSSKSVYFTEVTADRSNYWPN